MLEGTWQGKYTLTRGYEHYFGKKEVPFLFNVVYNYNDGGFEAVIEDDPSSYGIEIKSRVYGKKSRKEIRFVRVIDKTYFLPPPGAMSAIQYSEENFEVHYKGIIDQDEYVGFWTSNPTFRKIGGEILELDRSEGHWSMKRLR